MAVRTFDFIIGPAVFDVQVYYSPELNLFKIEPYIKAEVLNEFIKIDTDEFYTIGFYYIGEL